jgi:hypothetical protein
VLRAIVIKWTGGEANPLTLNKQIKKAKKYPANRCSLLANDVKHGLNTLVRNTGPGCWTEYKTVSVKICRHHYI